MLSLALKIGPDGKTAKDRRIDAIFDRAQVLERRASMELACGARAKALTHIRKWISTGSRSFSDSNEFSCPYHFAGASCRGARILIEAKMYDEAEGILRELLTWYYRKFRGWRHPIAGGPLGAIGVYATLLRERGDAENARKLFSLQVYPPARAPLFCFCDGFKPNESDLSVHPVYGELVQIGSISPFANKPRKASAPVLSTCVSELDILARHYEKHPDALDSEADVNLIPSLVRSVGRIAVVWKEVRERAQA